MYFLILLPLSFSLDSTILGDLTVSGAFSCSSLTTLTHCSSDQVSTSSLTSTDITTTTLKVSELTLNSIFAQDSLITIESDLIIYPPASSTAFYQVNWQIFSHNSFKTSSEGWTGKLVECNSNFYVQGSSQNPVFKEIHLPAGERLRMTANVHFVDRWEGESVILKVNDRVLWVEQGVSGEIDVCGGKEPDAGFAVPIDVIIPGGGIVKIEFSSTIREEKGTFGIDNIIIYFK